MNLNKKSHPVRTILGIDPGSRITGYGLVTIENHQLKHIDCGIIATHSKTDFPERLYHLFSGIQSIIQTYQPTEASIEQVFTAKNAASALKLGQARGAAITALSSHRLSISEYTPRTIKLAITGYGAADKQQVQQMVKKLLRLPEIPTIDAADAFAAAICHAHYKTPSA